MRRAIAAIGRVFITAGLLILLFVGYQLWGTGILEARAQDDLESEFNELEPIERPKNKNAKPAVLPPIKPGGALGLITIPEAGVRKWFVSGTSREDLQQGPGHYPSNPLPGQQGNAAIAGHRTTYGAPFFNLDNLEAGDLIVTESLLGRHVYTVYDKLIVDPNQIEVVDPKSKKPELTLTTCNPKYSAAQRLIIKAKLTPGVEGGEKAWKDGQVKLQGGKEKVSELPGFDSEEQVSIEASLAGDGESLKPALFFGLVAAGVGLLWWWAFRRFRMFSTWIVGVVPFLGALFFCYVYIEKLLPSGY